MDYDESELKKIIVRYMNVHEIAHTEEVIEKISSKIESVPREIHNFVIKLRDYLVKKTKSDKNLKLNIEDLVEFFERAQIDN
jgi:Holliday junction resolvasome RuvABC ATP-dependent DNA helicase subunit